MCYSVCWVCSAVLISITKLLVFYVHLGWQLNQLWLCSEWSLEACQHTDLWPDLILGTCDIWLVLEENDRRVESLLIYHWIILGLDNIWWLDIIYYECQIRGLILTPTTDYCFSCRELVVLLIHFFLLSNSFCWINSLKYRYFFYMIKI